VVTAPKTETLSVKVTAAEAAAIEARHKALGISRSAWLASLITADLAGKPRSRSAPGRPASPIPRAVFRPGPPAAGDCKHPKAGVLKGLCGACGTHVG